MKTYTANCFWCGRVFKYFGRKRNNNNLVCPECKASVKHPEYICYGCLKRFKSDRGLKIHHGKKPNCYIKHNRKIK